MHPTLNDKAVIERLIEFMRPVHSEMAALMTCARQGTAVKNCEMYVTTFPCHECARLIVAAGISRVYFIEPYPKSRVTEMYDDSIVVDKEGDQNHISFRAFVGVAPQRFIQWFEAPEPTGRHPDAEIYRRDKNGWVKWENIKAKRWPRESDLPSAINTREKIEMKIFEEILSKKQLISAD
ncbi:MAG: hypothetical protein JW841_09830 [Deltaproteobacteria bacterium]|nr:hypothetical protein [Deltaproteobacteria bacterium]